MSEHLADTNVGNIEYIRREDAIDDLHTQIMYRMGSDDMKRRLDDWVKTLPTADVVPVIRCKECMHYVQETPYRGYCTDTHSFGRYWRPDDFCSYGEREE